MSREIKFRAWDEGKKVMHTNVYFIKSGDSGNDWIVFSSDQAPYDAVGRAAVCFDNPYFSQQIKLMQYTGLKDKNGKEIYEWDGCVYSCRDGEIKGIVVWEQQACAFWFKWHDGTCHRYKKMDATSGGEIYTAGYLEVIGNIYENPELLKP